MGSEHISVATPFKAHPQPEMRLLAFGLDFSTLDIHFRRKLLPNIQIMAGAAEGMLAHSMHRRLGGLQLINFYGNKCSN
jgi:hypothetical protein